MKNSEKLRETRRGCEPHGQRWEGWGASRTGRDGVRAAQAGMDFWGWDFGGETRRDFETLGETGSESGNGGLKVGKERVVHFFGVGLIY